MSRAQQLRGISTVAERRMWRLLFSFRTDGFHFRKQVPIGPYVADVACHHAKLVIEVDGETHSSASAQRHDKVRDAFLRGEGYTVLRFANEDVLTNPEGVFDVVSKTLTGRPRNQRVGRPLPNPPHEGEGEYAGPSETITSSQLAAPSSTLPLVGRVGEGVPEAYAKEGER